MCRSWLIGLLVMEAVMELRNLQVIMVVEIIVIVLIRIPGSEGIGVIARRGTRATRI